MTNKKLKKQNCSRTFRGVTRKASGFCRQGRSRERARSPSAADWGKIPRSQSPASKNHSRNDRPNKPLQGWGTLFAIYQYREAMKRRI